MPPRPSNWIDFRTIRQTVPIEAVLSHYGVELRRVHGETLRGKCPLPTHSSKSPYTFTVHTGKNIFACQSDSCAAARHGHKGGNALDFVAVMENCSLREAAAKMAAWFPGGAKGVPRPAQQRVSTESREGQGSNQPLSFRLTGIDPTHPYLAQRGITTETAALFGIGFYGQAGIMRGRVVIPVHNKAGGLVAYAGRAIDGAEPKYRFPKGFLKSLEIFNLHSVLKTRIRSVIVVEGFFDAVNVHQSGFQNVVALMGSTLTAAQEKLLTQSFDEVTLMLDGDNAGREGTERAAAQLAGKVKLSIVTIPDGRQPDQLTGPELRQLMAAGEVPERPTQSCGTLPSKTGLRALTRER